MEEKNVALKPCLSHFVGERRPRPSNLPPTARRGGGGPRSGGGGRRRRHYKKLAVKPPPPPSEPGPRSGPSSRPLPSRCARHPPPGRGWAGNMEEKNVASNPAYPILWRGRRPRPSNLPPTARRWEGDHKVVEGDRRRRHYKNCGAAVTTTLGPKGRRPLSEANHNPSTQPAAPAAPLFLNCGEAATTTL